MEMSANMTQVAATATKPSLVFTAAEYRGVEELDWFEETAMPNLDRESQEPIVSSL